jgi:S-adenosylmethionine uptake transporter
MQSLWMLVASFVFSLMSVCVKLASDLYPTSEIVMCRGLIGAIFLYFVARFHGGRLRTRLPLAHLWRGIVGVAALWLWFYSMSVLPLAMSVTLNYTAPIWIAAILFASAWWRGTKRFEWNFAAAIMASFIGVTLLLRPSVRADEWIGGVVALGSGVLSALAYLQVKHLGEQGEPEYRVVFYFSLTSFIAGLAGSMMTSSPHGHHLPLLHAHTLRGALLLLTIGICATVAQVAMTRAYRLGNTLITANLQYTGIVFSSLWGLLIWGDMLSAMSWTGIAIILISGIAATYYNVRNAKAPIEEIADPIANEV